MSSNATYFFTRGSRLAGTWTDVLDVRGRDDVMTDRLESNRTGTMLHGVRGVRGVGTWIFTSVLAVPTFA